MSKAKKLKKDVPAAAFSELDKLRAEHSSILSRHRKDLAEEVQKIALAADRLFESKVNLTEFCYSPLWGKSPPSPADKDEVRRHVFIYVCGTDDRGRKSASFYNKVVSILKAEGVKLGDIGEEIQGRGGLRAIADSASPNRSMGKAELDFDDESEGESEDDPADDDDEDANPQETLAPPALSGGEKRNDAAERAAVKSGQLLVDVSGDLLDRVLTLGGEAGLKIRLYRDGEGISGFKRVSAKLITKKDR